MTANPILITIRTKKLGVLIRDARLATGKSLEECAQAVGVTPDRFEAYELGVEPPSLPELEILAYTLRVPLDHFWGNERLKKNGKVVTLDADQVKTLRQKMIGALLRKVRVEGGITLETVASKTGLGMEKLEQYELGEAAIPIPELESISQALNTSIFEFQDRHGPVGNWFVEQKTSREFKDLPVDLQGFVCKPINRPYLELAIRLSEMSVEKLRSVAEGLLEITL
ncbi:MAG TPA: helix-turn-helix transcriptional regulator [Anaerolineales bacterium]|nr:helix-turn-helix transcriptional regulator [Anaerolineales bacterium]